MSKGGIDRLIADAQDILAAQIAFRHDRRLLKAGSPIEALFEQALDTLYTLEGSNIQEPYIHPIIDKENFREETYGYLELFIAAQVRVLDWPVDFLIAVQDFNGANHFAVVECDGHDFHERTKEQAQRDRSRDRRLQDAGFRIFRFTGSELYRNPIGCAREVMAWADNCWQIGIPA